MDAKDLLIEKLLAEIAAFKETVVTLKKNVKMLEEKIARLEKNSNNSSKPPSSDIVKPSKTSRKPKRRKRKRGGQLGHRKCSRPAFEPEEVDEVYEYELSHKDAVGLKRLDEWYVVQQVHLPEQMYTVIEHRGRKYLDPATGQIHIAPIPDEIRKGGLLGADMTAVIAFLKGGCHMSYTTIQQLFQEVFKLDLSRGMLCKATQKVSQALGTPYQQLIERLPQEAYLGIDETGHHDDGKLHWTWCFQTPAFSVFHIDPSRGSQVLETILGGDFNGLIGADYWGAYRKYARLFNVRMQYCMAHLIREIRFLAEHRTKTLSGWGKQLLDRLKELFQTLHRQEGYTAKGYARRMAKIRHAFLCRMRRPPDHSLARKLAKRFRGQAADDYFRFLTEPDVEPTNNSTEREIRHSVIDRRITQGTRGDAGMRWCERIWTTIATCKKQNHNTFDFIHQSLLAHWGDTCYPEIA